MPFPGPSLILFLPALSARSFVVPALHSFSLPSHLQTVGWGFFPGLAGRAPDGHRLRHQIKGSFNQPVGVGAGSAPRREQTGFCVGVCLGGRPTPGQEARAATPKEAGPPSRAPPGVDFTVAAAALVCSVTSPCPELRTPVVATRSPPWPSSHPTPRFAFPPRVLIFPR